jgi:rhodanese-related sulfurtransferase
MSLERMSINRKEGFQPIQTIVRGYNRAHYYPGRKESPLKVIAVHCESGLRSYKVCLKLQHVGLQYVKNVDGGMLYWWGEMESERGKLDQK